MLRNAANAARTTDEAASNLGDQGEHVKAFSVTSLDSSSVTHVCAVLAGNRLAPYGPNSEDAVFIQSLHEPQHVDRPGDFVEGGTWALHGPLQGAEHRPQGVSGKQGMDDATALRSRRGDHRARRRGHAGRLEGSGGLARLRRQEIPGARRAG